jgi:2-polyprenyl-3-methyl-5-hydroxy-6-metoxy-1,4-benzoquinol methylase
MGYTDLLAKTREFENTTQLMGALGAELRLRHMGQEGDPRIRAAIQDVLKYVEPSLLEELEPDQTATVIGHLTSALQDALDLMNEPDREPGWGYTDPAILQERGRGSRSIPRNFAKLAHQRPDLEAALTDCDFLDIGTGVGWLAIEAAKLWPDMRIVGLDIWEPSLKLADSNISSEGLRDRITLRRQSVSDIDDEAAFDVVWLPGIFLPGPVVNAALPRLNHALRPGGFLFFGGITSGSESLGQALYDLQIIRRGGHPWRAGEITELLHGTGYNDLEFIEAGGGNNSLMIARR